MSGPGSEKIADATTPAAWALANNLIGEWQNTLGDGDTLFYEEWTRRDSSALDGKGFVMVGVDTIFIEDLKIERSGAAMAYKSRISTQNAGAWVEFQLQASGADTLLFTNPAHDFPKQLRYVRAADGAWSVRVGEGASSFDLRFAPRSN